MYRRYYLFLPALLYLQLWEQSTNATLYEFAVDNRQLKMQFQLQ